MEKKDIKKLDTFIWLIPKSLVPGMVVDGMVFGDSDIIQRAISDGAINQVCNVAFLPEIVKYSIAMPDIHRGYGLPIGGVVGVDYENGVVSPGGVGSDINCGVRLLKSDLTLQDIKPYIEKLLDTIFLSVPSGVGCKGSIRLNDKELEKVLIQGSKWAIEQGLGIEQDLLHTEDFGTYPNADTHNLSNLALKKGKDQLGTLGAGNHFMEFQIVDEIYDTHTAQSFGLFEGQIVFMIHTGSRGLGYQVCDDYAHSFAKKMNKYGINLPDRELACAPINSKDGMDYLSAMACAANYAWANRQVITSRIRNAFERILGSSFEKLGLYLLYDVCHNIAKIEEHSLDGVAKKLLIHRKGATRAFPKNHKVLPETYKGIGQPVIIPGDMGDCSYVLVGGESSMELSFGSTCHGAGRLMSRRKAIKQMGKRDIASEMENRGISIRVKNRRTLAEEAGEAYKDVTQIVDIVDSLGLSKKVAKLKPIGVIKG